MIDVLRLARCTPLEVRSAELGTGSKGRITAPRFCALRSALLPYGLFFSRLADFAFEALEHGGLVGFGEDSLGDGLGAFAPPACPVLEIILRGLADDIRAKTAGQSLRHGSEECRFAERHAFEQRHEGGGSHDAGGHQAGGLGDRRGELRGVRARHREAIDGGERADHRGVDGRAAEHVGHGDRIEADADDFQRRVAPDDLLGPRIAKLHAQRRDAVALVGGIQSGVEGDQRQAFAIEQLQNQRLELRDVGRRRPPLAALAAIGRLNDVFPLARIGRGRDDVLRRVRCPRGARGGSRRVAARAAHANRGRSC